MDFLIMVIAFYLAVGLFVTYAALKDNQFTESIFELGFLLKIFVMIVCILSAPIILINASTVFMLLSNEYQGIVTDANGNIVGDFPNCQTTITIMSGNDDVTADAVIKPTLRKGLNGEWDETTFTYTVTGLTEDNCYIEFTALYNDSTVKRRFTVCKQRYGKDGANAMSPIVSVTKKDGITTISITDETGTHTQEVLDGINGTPGTPGADGKTPYFHVKYSNDGGKTFTDNNGEKAGSYIGTYTDHIEKDSNIVSDYTWVKIEGKDGVSPTITVTKENGVVTIVTKDGSHTYTQKVLDGVNGTPGANGANGTNGQTTYFHLKYSNDGGKTFTSNNGEDAGSYIGTYTDFVKEDSDTPSDYTWAKIKGENGKDGTNGKGISEIHTYYQANNQTSGIYVYSSGWSEAFTAPSSSSKYLWTYQKTIYNDGSSESTSPHIIGTYGKDGKDGSTLSSSEIWDLLLQQNTDFMYKYNGNIYIKASYIDSGNLCGWEADRTYKRLTATATSSGSDGDIDLSYGGQVILDASKAMIKTLLPSSVYGGYNYAALCGNTVVANNAKIYNFLNNAEFKKGIYVTGEIQNPNMKTGGGTALYLSSGGYIKKSSSSKRYKKHVSFMESDDVANLYNLRPVYFTYKEGIVDLDDEDKGKIEPGFYAELIKKYFPSAVVYNDKGQVQDWDVRKLVPAMLKLIQLQKEQLDRQEERLSKIESILNIKEE